MRWNGDLAFNACRRSSALEELHNTRLNLIASRGRQWHLGLARAEGDLKCMGEAARRETDAGTRKLQPMQQERELGGAAQALLNACVIVLRHDLQDLFDRTRE